MAVVLRLSRAGAKKKPYYHVVATDSRNPRDGKFIEAIGAYDPNKSPPLVQFNQDRLQHWLKAGARPSETVAQLIKRSAKNPAPAATPAPAKTKARA
jgi:small subunit ribosomal protein S16